MRGGRHQPTKKAKDGLRLRLCGIFHVGGTSRGLSHLREPHQEPAADMHVCIMLGFSHHAHHVEFLHVVSQRCDTKELRKLLGDALDPYMKRVESRRFSVK